MGVALAWHLFTKRPSRGLAFAFHGDLELTNDLEALGFPASPDGSGVARPNVFSVGPALLWSPFYTVAHAYVGWERPGALPQTVTMTMNGDALTSASLGPAFKEIRFVAPEESLVPGENALCLRFSNGLPEDRGRRVAAHVERIQLP